MVLMLSPPSVCNHSKHQEEIMSATATAGWIFALHQINHRYNTDTDQSIDQRLCV